MHADSDKGNVSDSSYQDAGALGGITKLVNTFYEQMAIQPVAVEILPVSCRSQKLTTETDQFFK